MDNDIPNMPPRYMRKKDMTPEQLEAKKEATRKYAREWARAHEDQRWARIKARMATDPEYREKMLEKSREANAKRRAKGIKSNESPEAKAKRLQREREYKAKKYREWRLANPLPPKQPKEEKPKTVPVSNKKKPGRLLSLMGWRGF